MQIKKKEKEYPIGKQKEKPDTEIIKKDFHKNYPSIKIIKDNDNKFTSEILEYYRNSNITRQTGFCIYYPKENILRITDEFARLFSVHSNENLSDKIFNTDENKLTFLNTIKSLSKKNPESEFELYFAGEGDRKKPRVLLFIASFHKSIHKNENIVFCIVSDISERKYLEKEISTQKDNAEESDRIKTIFLKNIAHEIRTPMNAIIGFTELLGIGDLSPDKKKEYLSIIKNKSKHLLSLIDDIAELSKFETGDIAVNKTETNLIKLMNELHQEFNKEVIRLKKQNIELFLKLPVELNIINVYLDSGRVHQVMAYLLDNALKFIEKGYIQFGYELKDNRHLQFFVKDTGIGIAKEAQKFLFNRYKIKEEVYDKKYHNSGLGLTISRAIVESMGGKIHVESSIGQGAYFYFTIPLLKTDRIETVKKIEKPSTASNWRDKVILLAEDDEVNSKFIEAVFADTQVQLLQVQDGKQAVEICKTIGKIDLVLMDVKMPEKSGYEAIKEIKKFRKDLPIIVQTAYSSKEDKKKSIDSGANGYISKPIDIELLFNMINKFFIG